MELVDSVYQPRLFELRQRIIEARREAYKEQDWDKHAHFIQVSGFQELQIRDEILSNVLFKLDIAYEDFERSLTHYMHPKEAPHEYNLIVKMQTKRQQEVDVFLKEQLKDKLLTREQVLSISEQLMKLEQQVKTDFEAEFGSEMPESEEEQEKRSDDLQYRTTVAGAQLFDRLSLDDQIDQEAYFFSLKLMDIQSDPKFKALVNKYGPRENNSQ